MGAHTTRLPKNLENYIKMLISKGYAKNFGNALNLIVLERMAHDKEKGEISPFEYTLIDGRETSKIEISDLDMDNVRKIKVEDPPRISPENHRSAEDPPGIGAPLTPSADAGNNPTYKSSASNFGKSSKPPYPGTRREYEEALRKGTIIAGMFEPPEA